MTAKEAIEYIKSRCIGSASERDGTQWSDAMWTAIEALEMQDLCAEMLESAKPVSTDGDLISIQMAIEHWGRSSGNLTNDQIAELQRAIESLPSAEAEDRLYIKIYADDEPSVMAEKLYQICDETQNGEVAEWLKEYFPSADRPTGLAPVSEALPIKGQVVLDIDDKETWGDKGTWDVDKQRGW